MRPTSLLSAYRIAAALLGATAAAIGGTAAAAIVRPASAQTVDARQVDEIIDRAVAAWARIKTVRGTFEQTVTNPLTGTSVMSRGDYIQERPNRLSIRFTPPATGEIVADGQVLWIYLPGTAPGQVIKRRATDRSAVPIDLTGQFLDAPREKYDIAAAGTRTVDRHAAHGLRLTPKAGSTAPFTSATVWVGNDDSLIREFEVTDASGITRHVRLLTVQIDPRISQSAFVFTVPKGVKVIDQTRR